MSRRRARAQRSDKRSGILLMVVGAALIASLAIATFYVRRLHGEFDPKTNCPTNGPTAVHIVLIDRSDPISGQQAQRIRQWAHLLKAAAIAGERFDIYTFEGNTESQLDPVLTICAPQQVANPLYENEKIIQTRFQTKFVAVLDKTIVDLLKAGTKSNSPIIESLRAAALTSFGLITNSKIPLKITLISDLVQHSTAVSHFRAPPDFPKLSRTVNWAQLRPDLRGADVEILYVLRPIARRNSEVIQNLGHQQFWTELINAAGGSISEFAPF